MKIRAGASRACRWKAGAQSRAAAVADFSGEAGGHTGTNVGAPGETGRRASVGGRHGTVPLGNASSSAPEHEVNLQRTMSGGYTLIEMVGVLAIIAILAAVVTENILERMKRQMRETEASNLATFADAIRKSIARTKSVPGAGALPARIAAELSMPSSKVTMTPYKYTRYFLMHPDFRVGTNQTSTIPYTQTVRGSTVEPANCKVLIISSVGPIDEDLIPAEMTGTTFTNLWDASEEWDALARDVKLQRLELRDLFHRVILNNLDGKRAAPYSVESTNTLTTISIGGRLETWFIESTALNLHMHGGALQMRDIIREDVSYVFENGRWARYVTTGKSGTTGSFGDLVDAFLASNPNTNPKFYSTQQAIIDDMYNYLWYFALWATGDPANGVPPYRDINNPAGPQIPEYRVVVDAQARLAAFSYQIVNIK